MRGALRPVVLAAFALTLPATAAAAPVAGYDGSNPFVCELQQAGRGTDVPNPGADPFCVEYDKTGQNATELGVVEFLSKEPARVALASPKCFYYQRDHWRGSIVQSDERTETYSYDGSYFFDKARGVGGARVDNFTVGNMTGDPTAVPGFPAEYRPFFGPGSGGVARQDEVPVEERCVERARRDDPRTPPNRCRLPGGPVDRGIGGIRLGMTRRAVERTVGAPARRRRGFLRYCLDGGGKLEVAFRRSRAAFVLTTNARYDAGGIRRGDAARGARRRLRRERVLLRRGSVTVLSRRLAGRTLLVGLRRRRVSFLAVADRRLDARAIGRHLTSSR